MYQERPEHRESSPPDMSYGTARGPAHPEQADGPYTLIGPDGRPYQDTVKGILGGNRHDRTYGRLTCRAATQAIPRGGYTASRVFFASEADAIAAGYRPCPVCLPYTYAYWLRGPHDTP